MRCLTLLFLVACADPKPNPKPNPKSETCAATETCGDGVDNDCNGLVDGDDPSTLPIELMVDQDLDGFPGEDRKTEGCLETAPAGWLLLSELEADCDDTDATVNPGEIEDWYDGIDQDCQGGDDFDADADGYPLETDCDDTESTTYPGAEDSPYDGVDSDCLRSDDFDHDGDGHLYPEDCNDEDESVYPGAREFCDELGVDNNCDGSSDLSIDGWATPDEDGDGASVAARYYGDCDSRSYGLEYFGAALAVDCDDSDPSRSPYRVEICNGIDDDCDGIVDTDAGDAFWAAPDADGDGLGDVELATVVCSLPAGWVSASGGFDCADDDSGVGAGWEAVDDEIGMVTLPAGGIEVWDRWFEITRPTRVGMTEARKALFVDVMGYATNMSSCEGDCPAEGLNWNEAAQLANALSVRACLPECYACTGTGPGAICDGKGSPADCPGYRMPTTVEWEYFARSAGTVGGDFPSGGWIVRSSGWCAGPVVLSDGIELEEEAVLCSNSGGSPWPVGSLRPNASGLFDVAGNVCEYTTDLDWFDYQVLIGRGDGRSSTDPWWEPFGAEVKWLRWWAPSSANSKRIARGGSWGNEAAMVHLDHEASLPHATANGGLGVRLVRTLQ